ncbi:hypothetical protein P3S67_020697 [Capsicum chacoense]
MNIPILLRHSGIWELKIIYQSYKSDAIIILESINFLKLIATIAMKLNIDEVRKKIKVKYLFMEILSGAVLCIEGSESDSVVLTIVEIQNQYSLYVPEFEVKNFINDCKNTKIMVDQLYKDKQTLIAVMEKYAISNGFNTKELYRPKTIVKTYELPIVSMLDMKHWNVPQFIDDEEVLPLKYRRPLGRPKKGRHLKSGEVLLQVQTIAVNADMPVTIEGRAIFSQRKLEEDKFFFFFFLYADA